MLFILAFAISIVALLAGLQMLLCRRSHGTQEPPR
jgi:hypothetical protein